MTQASKASMKDSREKSSARQQQHHRHHNHASTSTSASVINPVSAINSDPTTKGLTTKPFQSRTSKKYDRLHHESIGRLSCDRKEDSDAQHHHDHNTSITASTTSSTVRGINLPRASHKKKKLFDCHHHAWGQQQCEHHHYDNNFASASTSASTTSRSTAKSDQSLNSKEMLDPGSQDEQLAGVGGWMEEYDDSYGGNYPQEVDLNGTDEPKEQERDG
ncbi:hypothetical protein BPAE_0336g00060 [Botrytis paeoniae]|uniref:Uncharacterized protein n=1 Tax=Botrytis paeoniae TaxID=278948 RepID=A0A4Z1F5U2_9HELO|nr:hypothetical protein BPAE_0336g00060 [Botrytis paeoniae]